MATAASPIQGQDRAGEQAANIIALLDAAKKARTYITMTLFVEHFDEGVAEYAFRLWASANQTKLEEQTNEYPESGYSIRSLALQLDPEDVMLGHVRLQWKSVPLAAAPLAEQAPAELAAPSEATPDNVIPLPIEPKPSSSECSTCGADHVDGVDCFGSPTDDTRTRFSLLELD